MSRSSTSNREFAAVVVTAVCIAIVIASVASQFWLGDGAIEIERAEPKQAAFEIDVSDASVAEFCLLPGIGEKLGRRIVDSRDAGAEFESIADLQQVKGIGPAKVAAMQPYAPRAETE